LAVDGGLVRPNKMAKNRKNLPVAVRFGPVLKVVLIGGLFCMAGVGYVWLKNEINRLGRTQAELEHRLEDLRRANKTLTDTLGVLHSPPLLDQRVREMNLGLAPAQPTQVVRLVEPVVPSPRPASARPAGGTP
jgi:hypothetical protein